MSDAMPATFCARSRTIRSWLSGSYETLPVTSAFSSPPMRCSSPGVPGIAHGRASVTGSRRYGMNSPSTFGSVANVDRDVGQRREVGQQPRLRAVREVRVAERNTGVRYFSAIRAASIAASKHSPGRRRRDDRHRRLGVAPVQHHQQVGLLGLRRHAGRRAGALDVEDQQRQLERDREPDRLLLQDDSRAGRSADAERAAEARAERRADRGDLVLGLEGANAEVLVPRELLEDRRRGRDRVRAEEERQAAQLRRRDQPVGERLVAGDVAVRAGRERRRLHLVRDGESLGRLAERVAGLERLHVRLADVRRVRELLRGGTRACFRSAG